MHLDRNKVKLAMSRCGFDMADLAKAMGTTRQNITLILSRKNSTTKTISRFSKALNCDPADIVTIDDK